MTPPRPGNGEKPAPFLPTPNSLGLPLPDRGEIPESPTRRLVDERWPAIRVLAEARRVPEAIAALEELARRMRRATAGEPAAWRDTLTQQREMVYRSLAHLAEHAGRPELGRAALERCRGWDAELAGELDRLAG